MLGAYRPNVAIIVTDGRGRVLLCQRINDPDNIQAVQGGIDEGETVQEAAERELQEELGIAKGQYTFLQALIDSHRYDWTPAFQKKVAHTGLIGQEQTFFLAQVEPGIHFNLDAHEREFEKVWWDTPQAMVKKAWPPKRPGLRSALIGFGLLRPESPEELLGE